MMKSKDSIQNHKDHDIVDNYVMVYGKKEKFLYCKDCKVEVIDDRVDIGDIDDISTIDDLSDYLDTVKSTIKDLKGSSRWIASRVYLNSIGVQVLVPNSCVISNIQVD